MNIYKDNDKFLDNKYRRWYYSIIQNAISQYRKKTKTCYFECHHILPRSLFPEYKNDNWNISLLTPREHFICHWLLVKMTTGKDYYKMCKAVHKMLQNRSFCSRYYAIAKKYNSISMSENNPTKCPEVRRKMSISAKNRKTTQKTRNIMSERNARYWLGKDSVKNGTKFYNNGIDQKMFFESEVPDGWIKGRLNSAWNKGKLIKDIHK